MLTLLAFLAALAVLVVFHELGHYTVARWCGVKVRCFSLGFGRAIWQKRLGTDQTIWQIAVVPLGGYVQMVDEREGFVAPEDLPRAFNRQTVGKRFAIVAAGPLANFLLAIALYSLLFAQGITVTRPLLATPPPLSPAAQAHLQAEDEIIAIQGKSMAGWQDVRWYLLQQANEEQTVTVTVLRQDQPVTKNLPLPPAWFQHAEKQENPLTELGLKAWQPPLPAVIGQILPDSAAKQAGLQVGDRIHQINQQNIVDLDSARLHISQAANQPLKLSIQRGTLFLTRQLTPRPVKVGGVLVGQAGIAPAISPAWQSRLQKTVHYEPIAALQAGLARTWETARFSIVMLGRMLQGKASWENLSGPITMATYAGQSAQLGWEAYLGFLALVSVSLGVLNLLPVPLLDGGHLMYYTAEMIRGRPLPEHVLLIGQKIGLFVLLLLMSFALLNDIMRLLPH